jgi:hypothetical protein
MKWPGNPLRFAILGNEHVTRSLPRTLSRWAITKTLLRLYLEL